MFLNSYDMSRAKMRIASKEIGYIKIKLNEQDEVYEKTFNVSSCRPGEKSASSINWEPRSLFLLVWKECLNILI